MRAPLTLLLLLALALPATAGAREYRARRSGHPLRIVAYVLHPIGYVLDRLIFYPAWWIAQNDSVGALVGMERTVQAVEEGVDAPRQRHPNVLIQIDPPSNEPWTPPEEPQPDQR
jgi:hypothetical protein